MLWPPLRTAVRMPVASGEVDGFDDVLAIRAIGDQSWTAVDHSVPNGARDLVFFIAGTNQDTRQTATQRRYSGRHRPFKSSGRMLNSIDRHGLTSLNWAGRKLDLVLP